MNHEQDLYKTEMKTCICCESSEIEFWKERMSRGIGIDVMPFKLFKCRKCRSIFINPRPTNELLKQIYARSGHGLTEPISLDRVQMLEEEYPNGTVDAMQMVEVACSLISGKTGANVKNLNALDIGSGYEFYSQEAIKRGFEVVAINPSIWENDIFEQINGFRPIQQFFEEVELTKKFNLVMLSQVLEHIDDPISFLVQIRKVMAPDGTICIAVPNLDSYLVKAGKDGGVFWIPEHLNCFSIDGLTQLLKRAGYQIEHRTFNSRFPYYAISNKLKLKGKSRKAVNLFVKIIQIIPLFVFDKIGWGGVLNVWASPIEE